MTTSALARPFPRSPPTLGPKVPKEGAEDNGELRHESVHLTAGSFRALATSASDDGDAAWRQKQAEIRELQEANKTLLQRVTTSRSSGTQSADSLPKPRGASPKTASIGAAAPGTLVRTGSGALAAYLPTDDRRTASTGLPPSGALSCSTLTASAQDELRALRLEAAEHRSELRTHEAISQQGQCALEEASRRNDELRSENQRLRRAIELAEHLNTDESTQARNKLFAAVVRWEDAAMRFEIECNTAKDEHNFDIKRLEVAQMEHRSAKLAKEEAFARVDEVVERRTEHAKHQVTLAEAAMQQLQLQLGVQAEENTDCLERLGRAESAIAIGQTEHEGMLARLQEAEQRHQAATQRLTALQLQAHGAEEVAEQRCAQTGLESQELAAAEERKKCRREMAKKAAEYQAWSGELREEMEESAAKAKESERNLHAKLSSARQERQRAESKLRAQIQVLQSECQAEQATSVETQELQARWEVSVEEVSVLKTRVSEAERECLALRQHRARAASRLQQKNEHLESELQNMGTEARRAIHSRLLEERDRCLEGAWERLSSVERQHSLHLEQLYESRDVELGFVQEQGRSLHEKLERQLEAVEASAGARALLLEGESEEVDALMCVQERLRAELAEARADAEGALQEHETLLEVLRREHEAADVQFQQLLQQAEEKQRRLGRLQGDTVAEGATEETLSTSARASPMSLATLSSTMMSKPLPSLLIPHGADAAAYSSRSSGCDPSSERGGSDGDGVDNVLRSMVREREMRRVRKLTDELHHVLSCIEQETGRDHAAPARMSWQEPSAAARAATGHRLLRELLVVYEQASQVASEDELRFVACREREASLRVQFKRLELRYAQLRRLEHHSERSEGEISELELTLQGSREEAGSLSMQNKALQSALDAAQSEMKAELAHAETCERGLASQVEESTLGLKEFREELESLGCWERGQLPRTAFWREHRLNAELKTLGRKYEAAGLELQEAQASAHAGGGPEHRSHVAELEALLQQHDDEHNLLTREIGRFQEQQLLIEERFQQSHRQLPCLEAELADARAALQESAIEQTKMAEELAVLEAGQEETQLSAGDLEAQLSQELQESLSTIRHYKQQVQHVREEKTREKSRSDKQLERLRARIETLEHAELALEKHSEHFERSKSRCAEESAQKIECWRREGRQWGATLQEAQTQEQHRARQLESAELWLRNTEMQLIVSEERCHELVAEQLELEASERACCSERRVLEVALTNEHEAARTATVWAQELSQRLQALEGAAQARHSGQEHCLALTAEVRQLRAELEHVDVTSRELLLTFERECYQVLPLLEAEDAKDLAALWQADRAALEAPFVDTFHAAIRRLASVVQENAELRQQIPRPAVGLGGAVRFGASAPGMGATPTEGVEGGARLAQLQKELIKLKEQNQELLHEKRLQDQRVAAGLEGGGSRSSNDTATTRSPGSQGGPENVYMRHQLKQAQQAKASAEMEVEELKQEMHRCSASFKEDMGRLEASVREERRLWQAEEGQAHAHAQGLERKVHTLEAKARSQAESQKQLLAEKGAVEGQLTVAAEQLESLLADEHKEGDLQRDLQSLSKQFEHLHGKHREQAAKAAEQHRQLQHEEALRLSLHNELREEKSTVEALRQQESARSKEVQDVRAEQASLINDVSQLLGAQQRQMTTRQELEERIQQLQDALTQAREGHPRARDVLHSIRRNEVEIEEMRQEVEASQAACRRAQSDSLIQASELAELRRTFSLSGKQLDDADEDSHEQRRTGQSRQPGRRYERGNGSSQEREEAVLVRTAQDSSSTALALPLEGRLGGGHHAAGGALPSTLDAFLTTLSSHEHGLLKHRVAAEKGTAKAGQSDPGTERMDMALEEVEKDFGKFARSIGFSGDIETLWAEARARATTFEAAELEGQSLRQSFDQLPVEVSKPSTHPGLSLAADVELRTVGRAAVRGYPDSPTRCDAASPAADVPESAQEAFAHAEALCEQQRFTEAVPLFESVLQILEGDKETSAPATFVAEVWAHRGVAMQSLDRVPEAVESYKKAVATDSSLHVCFANLATLHAYLREREQALDYINSALALDPQNHTYCQIKNHLDEEHRETSTASDARQDAGGGDVSEK